MIEKAVGKSFFYLLEDRGFRYDQATDQWIQVKDGVKTIVRIEQEWVGL